MSDSLKSRAGWLGVLAFLALPSCGLDSSGLPGGGGGNPEFDPGSQPHSGAIFCDIESIEVSAHCASPDEIAGGVPMHHAAVALVNGESGNIALDYSAAAISAHGCSPGQPVAITFYGPFPDGTPVCLNCGDVIGPVYTSVDKACQAKCRDLYGDGDGTGTGFCDDKAHAHASINTEGCVDNACTDEGALRSDFEDPRRTPEPVIWLNLVGTAASGADSNTLSRTAAATGEFDAGASSKQTIDSGDGYTEFTVTETNAARVMGLSEGASDSDPTLADMNFAVRLSTDGHVFIFEDGVLVPGPNPDTSFATYVAGDRLRVEVRDKLNDTAEVTYRVIPASCAGAGCDGTLLRTASDVASYPLRVDATFREQGATLTDAVLVRIK